MEALDALISSDASEREELKKTFLLADWKEANLREDAIIQRYETMLSRVRYEQQIN